jgi:DNA primase catalytic core
MIDLDRIKAALSCRDVAERLGISVPRKGDAECPKHKGQSLRLKDDFWKCWGCDVGGDVINLYQWLTDASFKDAVETLGRWAGVQVQWSADEQHKIQRRRQVEDVLAYAVAFYTLHYPDSAAQTYATERGWSKVADDARLGYAPDAWNMFVASLREAGIDLALALEAGLIRQKQNGDHFDLFRHRLVIPFIERGRVVYLQARSLGIGETSNGEPKYLNTALDEPPLYHFNGALNHTSLILTESTSDVLTFVAHGHVESLGTVGAEAKPAHMQRLKKREQVFVAAHNDKAGSRFADSIAGELGESVRIAPPPDGYKDWDEAFTAGASWEPDLTLTWFRWKLRHIEPATDPVLLRQQINPLLEYLAQLDEPAVIASYLKDMRAYFGWGHDIARGYELDIKKRQRTRQREATERQQVIHDDAGDAINLLPDVIFINPAQAYYDGIVYVSRQSTRRELVQNKFGARWVEIHRPVVVTSDRRVIPMPALRRDDPPGTVLYLDTDKRLALFSPVHQAATMWSYGSMAQHIRGEAPSIVPHAVYDAILSLFKRYLYHQNDDSYVIDVLWTIGTYFHQLFDAYPYLNIHGQKGSGKTTILVILGHLAFNAYHVTNVSEASLFRWIEAAAPTMLIDEQEGLTSRQAGREQKADLMGILKSGYQKGPVVTRQDTNDPTIMRQYRIYCPKAIASVELLEDILGDRSLLTYMHRPPDTMFTSGNLIPRNQMQIEEFSPIRDQLYLLLMQYAPDVAAIAPQVRMTYAGRFGELALPLFTIAALIDHSRGDGPLLVTQLVRAMDAQQERRIERNDTTPEQMFKSAIELAVSDAQDCHDKPEPNKWPQRLSDGRIVMDALHIADAFRRLFPSAKESYFRMEWLGKQVQKADFIEPWNRSEKSVRVYRWRRMVNERDELTNEVEPTEKMLSVYVVDVQAFQQTQG